MLKREYFIEQIDLISRLLCFMLFNKNLDVFKFEYDNYEFLEHAADLKIALEKLLAENKICDAEDLLFNEIEISNKNHSILQVALWFYLKLNELDDEILNNHRFSKQEILEGLKELENFVKEKFNSKNFE